MNEGGEVKKASGRLSLLKHNRARRVKLQIDLDWCL